VLFRLSPDLIVAVLTRKGMCESFAKFFIDIECLKGVKGELIIKEISMLDFVTGFLLVSTFSGAI
jgi:hypothetical protein